MMLRSMRARWSRHTLAGELVRNCCVNLHLAVDPEECAAVVSRPSDASFAVNIDGRVGDSTLASLALCSGDVVTIVLASGAAME